MVKGKAIPVQALRIPGVEVLRISRQWAHEGGKVVSPTPQEIIPGTHFC